MGHENEILLHEMSRRVLPKHSVGWDYSEVEDSLVGSNEVFLRLR